MNEKDINRKIEEAMHSIDDISKASPVPFFFTRLEARMSLEKNAWYQLYSFFARPAMAFACICVIIILNLAVIFKTVNTGDTYSKQGSDIASVDEYSQVTTGLYELDK
ncbi:MAG: hypothetical protein ABI594_14985 [Ginsengibacter sp.]